uniref:Uncharacterized protein n=1 Tax=Timema bartmani TaxID=61472 RepID=A0A7R9ERJ8_9NEOP|nr:unnamed protein product [Timema bartmani]
MRDNTRSVEVKKRTKQRSATTFQVEFRGSGAAFVWRESEKPFREYHPSSPERDSNLDLPVLSNYGVYTEYEDEACFTCLLGTDFAKLPCSNLGRELLSAVEQGQHGRCFHNNGYQGLTGHLTHKMGTELYRITLQQQVGREGRQMLRDYCEVLHIFSYRVTVTCEANILQLESLFGTEEEVPNHIECLSYITTAQRRAAVCSTSARFITPKIGHGTELLKGLTLRLFGASIEQRDKRYCQRNILRRLGWARLDVHANVYGSRKAHSLKTHVAILPVHSAEIRTPTFPSPRSPARPVPPNLGNTLFSVGVPQRCQMFRSSVVQSLGV